MNIKILSFSFSLFFEFLLLLLISYLIKSTITIEISVGNYSLCRSILGYTRYIKGGILCNIPCFIKPAKDVPFNTYGYCSKRDSIKIKRLNNNIYVNENGFISFVSYKTNSNLESTKFIQIHVYYIAIYIEKSKNIYRNRNYEV